MDWFRKLFGYPDRSREDGNPFRSPTWDEIMRKRDFQNLPESEDMQQPPGQFFHGGFPDNDIFSPHREFFGQMDDVFSQLEGLMREMHRHPAWTLPDSMAEPEPQTPRDFMLKLPDGDPSGAAPAPASPHPDDEYEDEKWDSHSGHEDFRQYTDPFTLGLHSFFDKIFQNYGMHSSDVPFTGRDPEIESGPHFEDHSRESLIKNKDSDIDDRVSGDLSKLPEGGPGYSHTSPQTSEPRWSPWSSHPEAQGSPHSGVQQKFYSQSIVTIRRPDGSIEETKKYRDSTGREEVTVTHSQPEGGTLHEDPLQPGGAVGRGPSIFSWFFTR